MKRTSNAQTLVVPNDSLVFDPRNLTTVNDGYGKKKKNKKKKKKM